MAGNTISVKTESPFASHRTITFERYEDNSIRLAVNGYHLPLSKPASKELVEFLLPVLSGGSRDGFLTYDDAIRVLERCGRGITANTLELERKRGSVIEWKPGDVIVVTFPHMAEAFTYVRGKTNWPGDKVTAKTDENVNAWRKNGWVKPLLQQGGVPFDSARIPAGAK